ncbi:MAG: hypothetical protein ACYC0H_19300 [Solirubrobacteraceae bacterium]
MSNPLELLRRVDPHPTAKAPPIERLWSRVAAEDLADIGGARVPAPGVSADKQRPRVRVAGLGLRRAGSRLVVAISVVLVVVIAVGAVLTLHGARRPTAPAPPMASGLPSAQKGLVGILAVLRRPQTNADRSAAASAQQFVAHIRAGQPVSALIRLATVTPWGQQVVLIPIRPRDGTWPSGPAGSAHGLRLATFSGGAGCCISAAGILRGQAWTSAGSGSLNYVVLVVPDGVTRVTVAFGHPVTATVHNNIAAFKTPTAVENLGAYTMTWYSRTGAVLKRFPSFLPTPAQQQAERPQRIHQAERSTTTMAPAIRRHFALFATSALGTFHDGATTVTISQPPIPSWPTFLLDQWTASGFDLHHVRKITARGTTIWILATKRGVLCAAGAPGERVGSCSGDPGSTSKFGFVTQPALPAGGRLTIGIVPSTNHTITVKASNGHTRIVPVIHGMFVTSQITGYQVTGVNGKTAWNPL